ncbi:MAG: polymer-forming cytoskeletal protein [Treponema sp.]|nr:polymer-forming cytoskeletal protein [Treponema sp.]
MPKHEGKKKEADVVVLGKGTRFNGVLKFKSALRIQGKFKGTIDATGALTVDKDAVVEADRITVSSLTVHGSVAGAISAVDKVDMMSGAQVRGDVKAARLRIADGVLFEGHCSMTGVEKEIEIFSRPIEDIKADFQR